MNLPTLDAGRTLTVGLDDAPPHPLQFGSPETGDFRGYEVDLLQELSRRTGTSLRWRRSVWSTIIADLEQRALDIICSAATIAAERRQQVDFCLPHPDLTLAIVRRQDDTRALDLSNGHIGVRKGTTAEVYAKSRSSAGSFKFSESNDDLYAALGKGEIDALADDSPIAKYFSRLFPGLRVAGIPGTEASYGIMIRKGNIRLREALNELLIDMEGDGTLQHFRQRWLD